MRGAQQVLSFEVVLAQEIEVERLAILMGGGGGGAHNLPCLDGGEGGGGRKQFLTHDFLIFVVLKSKLGLNLLKFMGRHQNLGALTQQIGLHLENVGGQSLTEPEARPSWLGPSWPKQEHLGALPLF